MKYSAESTLSLVLIFVLHFGNAKANDSTRVVGSSDVESTIINATDGVAQFWFGLDDLQRSHNVKYVVTTKRNVRNGHAKLDGPLSVVRTLTDEEQIELKNNTYSATIVKSSLAESNWSIRWIGRSGGSVEETVFSDMFNMQVADPAGLGSIMKKHLYSQIDIWPDSGGYTVHVSDSIPVNSGVHSHYKNATFRVTGHLERYPLKLEITSSDGFVVVSEFSDFVVVNGNEIPQVVKVALKDDAEGSDEYRFDYSGVSDIFNYDECFLSYYGLPEPDEKPTIPWRWPVFFGLFMLAAVLLFFSKRL